MHVIIVTDSNALSGGSRQALYQAQALHAMGKNVTVVVKKDSQLYTTLSPTVRCCPYEGNVFSMASAIKGCIRKDEATIIHSYHNIALKVLSFWGMLWKMEYPLVRCVSHRGVSMHPRNPFPYWASGVDRFLPNSEAVGKQLSHFLPFSKELISVVYNGIPMERIRPKFSYMDIKSQLGLPEDENIFISVLNGSKHKGCKELLEAFEQMNNKSHLITIGVQETFIKEHISSKEVLSRIHVISTSDVADYLVHADCFIFPSCSFDSLPNVVIEAMGVGLPIIATNVGGIPELVKDNGIRIAPNDVQALRKAMEYVVNNRERLEEWSQKSKEYFIQFRIEERMKRLLEIYEAVLDSPMRGIV